MTDKRIQSIAKAIGHHTVESITPEEATDRGYISVPDYAQTAQIHPRSANGLLLAGVRGGNLERVSVRCGGRRAEFWYRAKEGDK